MRLIVGLGNPGSKYENTRHNAGFMVIDQICQELKVSLDKTKFNGDFAKVDDLIIAKPHTFMNLSGEFVSQIANFYKIPAEDIMIIHDEKDFEVGQAAIKIGGSDAGHNGIKSVTQQLGTPNYKRLRVGIGRPNGIQLKDFVLQTFSSFERDKLNEVLRVSAKAAISFAFNDINTVMNSFNQNRKK
ncbi:aminoacyl-tRNA hydrolase [Mycoplasma sp. Ms02]|uniref:aminoacyl-tRNA hydrolase n=1 Tax=Mycoplasma sp. Ms02 TaxID=353851 RepID=UPI001C89A5B5|nr:aminoacyl-tRNA hydrolase [Mycoplasma sp. Ms02]QZE12062.1 aminoacyl-tRNA hydrolase [Mycoplasma sp. Ms02]